MKLNSKTSLASVKIAVAGGRPRAFRMAKDPQVRVLHDRKDGLVTLQVEFEDPGTGLNQFAWAMTPKVAARLKEAL